MSNEDIFEFVNNSSGAIPGIELEDDPNKEIFDIINRVLIFYAP